MSTLFVLADGRIWGTSNGTCDDLLELIGGGRWQIAQHVDQSEGWRRS